MDELISRAEAVKAALALYHTLAEKRDDCQREKDLGGSVMWTAAAEIAQAMVRQLVEVPAVDAEMVVRCSDCVFSSRALEQPCWLLCGFYRLPVPADFYCGQGRAKGGETSAAE